MEINIEYQRPQAVPDVHVNASIRRHGGLKAHWTSYISVIGFLFLINFFTGIYILWAIFPALSWGVGLLIHTGVVKAKDKHFDRRRLAVAIHGTVTWVLIGYFLALDYFTGSHIDWFVYPALPVLLGWLIHAGVQKQLRKSNGNKAVIGYKIHRSVFLSVGAFFLAINYFTSPWALWFYWPLIPWSLGLTCHFIALKQIEQKKRGIRTPIMYNFNYLLAVCAFFFLIDIASGRGLYWFWYPSIPILGIGFMILMGLQQGQSANRKAVYMKNIPPIEPRQTVVIENAPIHQKFPGSKFCPNCGAEIGAGHQFCESCGFSLQR